MAKVCSLFGIFLSIDLLVFLFKNGQNQFQTGDDIWTDWSPASECSVTCGGGTRTFLRLCGDFKWAPWIKDKTKSCNSFKTPRQTQDRSCNPYECPTPPTYKSNKNNGGLPAKYITVICIAVVILVIVITLLATLIPRALRHSNRRHVNTRGPVVTAPPTVTFQTVPTSVDGTGSARDGMTPSAPPMGNDNGYSPPPYPNSPDLPPPSYESVAGKV